MINKVRRDSLLTCALWLTGSSFQPKAPPAVKSGAPSTPAPQSASTSTSTPSAPAAPAPNTAAVASPQPSTPTPGQPTAPPIAQAGAGFNDPSAFLIGNRSEPAIREMEAMGFARPEIERALRAAYFNPERAIEYLLSGIPESIQAEQRHPPPAAAAQGPPTSPPAAQVPQPSAPTGDEPINLFEAAAQAGQQGRGGVARGGAAQAAAATGGQNPQMNIEFLRQSPHFHQLRQLVQQQPAMLEPILQQLAEGNPQLAQMIGQNSEQFLQLLAEVWLLLSTLLT